VREQYSDSIFCEGATLPDTRPTSWRLLHVEDSSDDAELVAFALRGCGLARAIERVDNEADYVAALDAELPDAIICDYNLPHFSAERALAILNERGLDIPFLIVSHHLGESAAVLAMQHGASDYLPKHDLGRLAKAIGAAIERTSERAERAQAQEALRRSEALTRSILDSLQARIAVLDGRGVILAVNRSWAEFTGRTPAGVGAIHTGENYIEVLQGVADRGIEFGAMGIRAIRSVMAREQTLVSLDYHFTDGESTRWYLARVTPLEGSSDGVVVTHQDITDRMMAHVALDNAHRRLQALSKRVLSVQEEERRALSRELHDDFGQSLTALKIGLHRLGKDSPAAQQERIAECLQVADTTLEKIRALALDLRPPQLDQLGLPEALESLAQRQKIATGIEIHCNFRALAGSRAPAQLEAACYRIAQEAINNASRHGNAKRIDIGLEVEENLLRIAIHDDGVGFDQEATRQAALKAGSLGLIGMEERAQLAGGRLKLRSVLGGGTTVSAIFPLAQQSEQQSERPAA